MKRIKHLYATVLNTWTYNHKHLIITLSLAVALVVQSGVVTQHLPEITIVEAYTFTQTYEKPVDPLEVMVEKRALELYEERRAFDLEGYRQEAIRELNSQLLETIGTSPFVDYEELEAKYGY